MTYRLYPHMIPASRRPHLAVLIKGDTRPAGPMSNAPVVLMALCILKFFVKKLEKSDKFVKMVDSDS